MLCCVGLFGGLYIGEQLGGPWIYIAPAVGFGLGLIGDMKFMHKSHKHASKKAYEDKISDPRTFQKPKNELPGVQDVASKELLISENKYSDPP